MYERQNINKAHEKFALARRLARAPGPPHRACLLHHHQVLPRRPCGLVVIRAALPIARALCHDFLAATVTATLATTALATDTALSVTIVLPQDVQLHVLVYRPRCSACEGRGVRGLQDARGILGEVHTHGMVGHRSQLFVLASLLCATVNVRIRFVLVYAKDFNLYGYSKEKIE